MAIDYSKLLDGNSLKAIRTYVTTNFQPLNANLTSIAALATNVSGLIKMTNGVASLDGTEYAPKASPTFTGTVTLPTSVKIGTSTATGLVKYTNGVLSIDTNSYALSSHTHTTSIATESSATSSITLASGGKYKLTAGGTTFVFTMPTISVFPSETTANKVLLSTTTSGTVKWSDWSSAGFLKTGTNGAISIDTNSYQVSNANLTAISNIALSTSTSGFIKLSKNSSGTVSAGATSLAASDIPNLDASKITSGTFADARIASAATWNAKYTKPSGGIPASDLAESYILTSARGAASGVASLGSDGKIPTSQLPDSVVGSLEYKGTFNATSGSTISGLEKGWYYICATAGSKNPDGTTGPSDGYEVGDWAVYNGTSWDKIDNSDKVSSVNGKTGAVTLSVADISGAVSYSGSQSLTDTQKAQARTNIGAGVGSVTSVRVQAGTGLASSQSTAQTSTLNTTISIASGYKLPTTTEWNNIVTKTGDETISGTKTHTKNIVLHANEDSSHVVTSPCLSYTGFGSGYSSTTNLKASYTSQPSDIFNITLPAKSGTVALLSDIPSLTNYVTLDGTQTITGNKTFSGTVICSNTVILGSAASASDYFTITANNNAISSLALKHKESGADSTTYLQSKGGTAGGSYYLALPAKGSVSQAAILATIDDITSAVSNCYTEQEALDILNGTAS